MKHRLIPTELKYGQCGICGDNLSVCLSSNKHSEEYVKTKKFKKCPFCGESASIAGVVVFCKKCGAMCNFKNWNKRWFKNAKVREVGR